MRKLLDYNETDRLFNFPSETMFYNNRAETCMYSKKEIRNNSVYCLKLQQWVATNLCQNQCQNFIEETK